MQSLFDTIFGQDFDNLFSKGFNNTKESDYPFCIKTVESKNNSDLNNVTENKTTVTLTCDMPGVKKNDIKVIIKKNDMVITGIRKAIDNKGKEYSSYTYKYSYILSDNIDKNNVKGKYENGVLTVTLPKKEKEEDKESTIIIE